MGTNVAFIPGGGGPIEIEESTSASFTADLSGVNSYEVRITYFGTKENVVSTSQGIQSDGTNAVGQTVLNRDFSRISQP